MHKTKSVGVILAAVMCAALVSVISSGIAHAAVSWGGIPIWFRTNVGLTAQTGKVAQWINSTPIIAYSGWRLSHRNASLRPDYIPGALNGYPIVRMDSTDVLEQRSAGGNYDNFDFMRTRMYDNYHVFYAGSITAHNNENHCLYRTIRDNDNRFDIQFAQWNGGELTMVKPNPYAPGSWASQVKVNQTGLTLGVPRIYSFTHGLISAGSEGGYIRIDGKAAASQTGIYQGVINPTAGSVYVFNCNGGDHFEGDIAELLVYTGALNTVDRQTIESYLAIKYGRHIDQTTATNYYNAAGTTVWNASTNSSYNNSIFGVANDTTNGLSQLQSESSVTTGMRIVASTLANQQYHMVGDNAGALTWGTSGAPQNMNILGRRWLVQETGPATAYTTTRSIPTNLIPAFSGNLYLAYTNNTDFTTGVTLVQMTNVSSRWTASNIDIPHGRYVTLVAGTINTVIGDRVWIDTDKDGIQDAGELGLAGVTVSVKSCGSYTAGTQPAINYTGTTISTTTTNSAGNYSFTVAPGLYYLEFTVPSTYKFTTQHAGGYGTNTTTNSDTSTLSAKTRCETFNQLMTDTSIDAGVITQTYSSCDSMILSNVATVGGNDYQKPGVSFTVNLVGYGQTAIMTGTNVTGLGSTGGSWRAITWSPAVSSSVIGVKIISGTVDGVNYKLDYYNNASIQSLSCPYRTVSAGVFCAESAPLAPYKTSSLNMNTSPTTIAPVSYCTAGQSALPCTAAIDRPQSALVRTDNTCVDIITILDEPTICSNLVNDVPTSQCNALLALYTGTAGASWTTKTNWMFNGDTTWNTVCDRYGVTCAGGRITQLNLPNNNLSGTLPNGLSVLTGLTNIDFSTNNIQGSLPTTWSTLTNMRYFNVGTNTNLNTALPTGWSTWTQMIGIWLANTAMTGTIPTQWSTWTQLQTFIADRPPNGIGFIGTLPSTWSTMTNLRNFQISNNSLNGQIPTSRSALTQMRAFLVHNNNLDGPLPTTIQSWTSLDTNGWNSVVSSNCFGTGGLETSLVSWLDSRFKGDATTSWNNAATYGWRVQKQCATDIRIVSASITQGDFVNGGSAVYSVTIANSGSRWAYSPKVTVTLNGGLSTSTPTLLYDTLAPGETQTRTLIVIKNTPSVGTNNITNTFVLSDPSITDSSTPNNTLTHVTSVKGSMFSICNNSNVVVSDCEALMDIYIGAGGASWTNKTNWNQSDNIDNWYNVTTTNDGDLAAYYSFDSNNAFDDSYNLNTGTLVNSPTFVTGMVGRGINLNGGQKRVSIPNTNLPKGAGNFTYTWWAKWNATPTEPGTYFSNGQWPNIFAIRQENPTNTTIYAMGNNQGGWSTPVVVGERQHYAVVRNGNLLYMYVNGVSVGSFAFNENIQPSANLFIGLTQNETTTSLNAIMDEVRIYNRALSVTEVNQLYTANGLWPLKRVTSLMLNGNSVCGWGTDTTGNNVVGTLPASLGNLTGLTQLCIAYNPGLVGGLPSTLGNLRSMSNLVVHNNVNLQGPLPANLHQMNPSVIWMPNNGFTGGIAMLTGWTNTTYLALNDNKLSGLIPASIGGLNSIYRINLANNIFNGALPDMTALNDTLRQLYLNNNATTGSFTGPIPSWMYNMTNLTTLYLGSNALGGTLSSSINNLVNLIDLRIESAQIGGSLPNITIPTLQYLVANSNSLTGSLPSLPNSMYYIHLTDNNLNGALPSSWGSLSNLAYMYLYNNKLSGLMPTTWAGLSSLISLGLGNNELEGALPVATLQSMTSLTSNANNMLGTNCFYTGALNASQISYLDTRFNYYPTGTWAWRNQRICGTDLEVVSAVPVGDLDAGRTITYTVTLRNNGTRAAYDPRLTVTLTNGLQFSDSASSSKVISLGQINGGQTTSQVITVNKLGVGSTTIPFNNSFVISDVTITDATGANNTKTHTGTARGSSYSICINPATTVIQSDCEALGDLYTSTAGANWANKTNWLTSTDVESWFGITISANRVYRICMVRTAGGAESCSYTPQGNNLNGPIPASIGDLTGLQYLLLSYNNITGPLPTTIDQLDNVNNFYINNTTINDVIPTQIGGMNSLVNFYAWSAGLTGSIPATINDLPAISYLGLYTNNLRGTIPDMSDLNDTLRTLYLHNNSLGGGIPSWVSAMNNVNIFYIGNNPLGGTIPAGICNLTAAAQLYIHASQLTGPIPACIWNLTNLTHLAMYSNNLTGSIPSTVGNLTKLQYLQLGVNANMRGPLPAEIGNITGLKEMYLPSMGLIGAIPENLTNIVAPNRFDVAGNYLDRDLANNALMSPALTAWYDAIVPAAGGYKLTGNQSDITAPLLGANATSISQTPGGNYNGQPVGYTVIAGPNGNNVQVTLLGGTPYHVYYDKGHHGINLQNGKTYTFSFWARAMTGSRTIVPMMSDEVNAGGTSQTWTIDTTWRLISVKKTYTSVGNNPRLFITNDGLSQGAFYYYNPVVTESTDIPSSLTVNSIMYPLLMTESSDWDVAGRAVTVGGGGTCSNLTVTPNQNNDLGIYAYYNFDTNDGSDKSTNGRNGSIVGGTTFVQNRAGSAAKFTTTGDRISSVNVSSAGNNITRSAWINREQAVNVYNLFMGQYLPYASFRNDGKILWSLNIGGQKTIVSTSTLTDNQWYMVTFTYDGTTLKIYINGVLDASQSQPGTIAYSANTFTIGDGQASSWYPFKGKVDDVRIYSRTLSATEISQLYGTKINISAGGIYNGCFLTVSDRNSNTSNAVRLGDFSATFSPYSICNHPDRTIPQSECTALMQLYMGTNGTGWTNKTNWGTNPDINSWFGVTTTTVGGQQYVSQICINRNAGGSQDCGYVGSGNNMSGTLPTSIGDFPYLTHLNLSNNPNLTGPIPTTVGNLTNLVIFYAIGDSLNGSLPNSMTNLNSLTNLYLWGNSLSGPLPSAWGTGMASISYIHLDANDLSGPIPATWANFADTMTALALSNQGGATKLNGSIPSWLGNFSKLNFVLYLHNNQFTGPIPSELGNLTGVQYLTIGGNQLSGPIPSELGNMKALRQLSMNTNQLTGTIPTSFTGLTNLTNFAVEGNRLNRDLSNNALIPSALSSWYAGVTTKNIQNQSDSTAPIISGSPLAGTYGFDTMSYTIELTENSMITTGGQVVTVAGGGTCAQLTVSGTLTNNDGANIVLLKFATGSSATTNYSNCTLTTTDRGSNVSNSINLGNWSVTLQPYPICNSSSLTTSQAQCVALMDFYSNLGGNSWTNKTNWGTSPAVTGWYGISLVNSAVSYYSMDANANDISGTPAYNGTHASSITFTPGRNGNAATFPASHTGITASVPSITKDQTICMWLKPDNLSARRNPYNKAFGGEGTITQEVNGSLNYYYGISGIDGGTYVGRGSTVVMSVGQWTHICLVRDLTNTSTITWYANGAQNNVSAAPYPQAGTSAGVTTIGNGYAGPYNGQIDDVRIFNRALSAAEITQIYQSNQIGGHTVTAVRFTGSNNLAGSFPNVFDRLPNLLTLEISSNPNLTGSIPSSVSTLPVLTTLSLNSLGIVGTLPSTLPSTLQTISVNGNSSMTAGPLPSAWSLLTGLTYLSIQGNNSNGTLPASWSSLVNLTYFHLGSNNFNSQVPTSWLTNLTGVGQMYWESAYMDGPLPVEFLNWNINTAYASNNLSNNCFGTGHLTPEQVNAFDTMFTRARWAIQRKCNNDIGLSVSSAGNLTTSNAMIYTMTVTNNGTRWSYDPKVTISLQQGLQSAGSSSQVVSFDTLAPGQSQTQTIVVVKSASSPTTQTNATNTFTLSDATITDTNSSNNTVTNVQAVRRSSSAVCYHYALNIPVAECEGVADLYTSTNGASWTNKTNWLTTPNTDSRFGLTTNLQGDLVAHYDFDVNDSSDESGNGKNGTSNNLTFTKGIIATGLDLNGSNAYINLGSGINSFFATGGFTISAWINTTVMTQEQTIFSVMDGDTSNYIVFRKSDFQGDFKVSSNGGGAGSIDMNFSTEVRTNKWVMVTAVYNPGGQSKLYINGAVNATASTPAQTLNLGARAANIGRDGRNVHYFKGLMDEVRIFGRPLSDTEVTNLYQTATLGTDRVTKLCMSNAVESTACNYGYQTVVGNNLSGTLPASLGSLTEMTHLVLNKNNLSGPLPTGWSTLTKLYYLGLEQNKLSGTLPTTWGSMSALTYLGISDNPSIGGAFPASYTGTSLTHLWANNNSFTSLPDLSALNWGQFQMSNSNLSGVLPSWIGTEALLGYLFLNGNNFIGSIPLTWGGLQSLQVLFLYNNNLTGNFDAMSSPVFSNLVNFQVQNNNFDRDHNNNAIVPANIAARIPSMGANYHPENQGDITAPVISSTTTVASTIPGSFTYALTVRENSSTTGAGFLSGLSVVLTGSTQCATKLVANPSKILTKSGVTNIEIAALEQGTYAGCQIMIYDRAGLASNKLTFSTFTAPDYGICNIVTDITRPDCIALIDIYNSTIGSGWTTDTNWKGLTDATPTTACDWFGIQCSGGRVSGVCLNGSGSVCNGSLGVVGNNLGGSLPSSITNLTGLVSLMLQNNNLGGIMPVISNISTLRNLYLQGASNDIGGPLPDLPAAITNVYLSNNNFTGGIPLSYCDLTAVTQLYIGDNPLGGTLPHCSPGFATTAVFDASYAQLTGQLPAWTSTTLGYLQLNDNNLNGPIPVSWGLMTNLRRIRLQSNNIEGFIPESFTNLVNLTASDSNLNNNCLSTSSTYLSSTLQNFLTTKFNNRTTQKVCKGVVGSKVWLDTDNDGLYDNGETGTGGVTVTLKACTDQTSVNTGKVLNHQLASFYTFDEANTNDDSNNGRNATPTSITYSAGKVGNAATSNGGYLTHSLGGMSPVEGTISAWVNPTQNNRGLRQASDIATANLPDWIALFAHTNGNFYYRIGNGTTGSYSEIMFITTGYITVNQWVHISATWSGDADGVADDTMRLYINGTQISVKTNANFQSNMSLWGRIGYGHSQAMYGKIDDFRAYGRALSAAEIGQLYNIDTVTPAVNIPIGYAGATVASTTTATNGTYSFANITGGKYYIEYSNIPNGYKFTTQNQGGYHNSANSDVNPWSAKTSCFEVFNGRNETDVNAGLKYLPYSSCEAANPAYTPILLGQPVMLSIGGYGVNGQIQAITTGGSVVLNQSITNQGTNWGLKTWTHAWTPSSAGTYTISGAVDGYNYSLDYYNNPSLLNLSCAYRTISAGNWCAVQSTVSPYSGTVLTNVNQISTIPSPIQYCTPAQISSLPCSTAGNQPPSMVVQVPNTCVSSLIVTSDINVMCDAVTDMQPAECKALVSLYDSTAGSSWFTKTNRRFLGDTTPRTACDWYGISCAGGRVTQITLTGNNLGGSLPALTGLTQVSQVHFGWNGIGGTIPSIWSTNMPSLATVNLHNNGLTGTLPVAWSSDTSLVYININDNQLVGTLPASWSGMTNLTHLLVGNNNLSGLLPTSWSALTKAIMINLQNNSFTGTLPASWSNLRALTSLYLSNNSLQDEIPTSWFTMTGLSILGLNNNELDGPIPSGMTTMAGLTSNTSSDLQNNCLGTTHISGSLQLFLNAKFPSRYLTQKTCQTDLQLSLVSKTGSLFTGNTLTYILKYTNAGSRWSYNTVVGLSRDSRLHTTPGLSTPGATDTGINLGMIAPGTSGTVTFVLNKTGFGAGVYSVTNVFTLTDTTISDTNAANHTYTDSNIQVLGSSFPICTHPNLTIQQLECETLMTMYSTMNGANWTNKTNWGTTPDVDSWYGVLTSNSLIAYYPFDGNANDNSTPPYTGTANAGVNYVAGKFGQAANVLTTGWVTTRDMGPVMGGTNELTWSAWINRDSSINDFNMFMGQNLPYFGHQSSGKLIFSASIGGSQRSLASISNVLDNQWTFATATYDGDRIKIYINGVLDATSPSYVGSLYYNPAYQFSIGDGRNSSWYPFDGQIDEVRVFNRALKAAEVEQLYYANRLAERTANYNRVTSLSLGANNISGAIPSIITNLPGLTHFDMVNKPGSGMLPDISVFADLTWLRCDNCALTGAIPANITSTKLANIYLANNKLTSIPSSLYTMNTIRTFSIANNPIGGTIPSGFASIVGLVKLDLSNAGFTGAVPSSWSGLRNLQYMSLDNNTLDKELPSALQYLTGLRGLYLDNNELDGPIPEWLTGLVNLQ